MNKQKVYLGVDLGSTSLNLALVDENKKIIKTYYYRNHGPIPTIQKGIKEIKREFPNIEIIGAGTTGSGRNLASIIIGADIVKNEITAHAMATLHSFPKVKTIIELGGQDSKLIILRNGVVVDFAMNTVCAAGCGAFLDTQANKLGISIDEFGDLALQSKNKITLSSRCTVFCESDVVHKLNNGISKIDILNGLAHSLVRNYMTSVCKGKEIQAPIVFQGAPSKNKALVKAFEQELGEKISIPPYADCMGAIGIALITQEHIKNKKTAFKGFRIGDMDISTNAFECKDCPNNCEVVEAREEGKIISRWGDRCGKYSAL